MVSLAARRSARRPALDAKLRQMALRLSPLVQIDTGLVHPAFPRSLVQFWLLTDDQLESLASFYHQRTPQILTRYYPCPVYWPREGLSLEDKRRKLGRFIGLRGCDTPAEQPPQPFNRCGGNCSISYEPVGLGGAPNSFCRCCSLRQIEAILWGDNGSSSSDTMVCDDNSNGSDNGSTASVADSGYHSAPSSPVLRPARSSARSSSPRPSRPRSASRSSYATCHSRPATAAGRVQRSASPPRAAAPRWRPLTVENVIDDARRARLEADADEEAMRRKAGHY